MARVHVFADESGNFDFSTNEGATRFFILTTVTFFEDRQACHELENLRYALAWEGAENFDLLRASEDKQAVRDRVFQVLDPHGFRVDSTIMEKRKSQPQLRTSAERFYQYAWFYHMKRVVPHIAAGVTELMVVAASIGVKGRRDAYHRGVRDVMEQVAPVSVRTAHWPAPSRLRTPDSRLLLLGHPTKVGTRGLTFLRPHRGQDQVGVRFVQSRNAILLLAAGKKRGRLSLRGEEPGLFSDGPELS